MESNFEIKKVQNGFQYTNNGQNFVDNHPKNVTEKVFDMISKSLEDAKPGDVFKLEIKFERQ
jgi:hypothetical protein